MSAPENSRNQSLQTTVDKNQADRTVKAELLKQQQDEYISYCAVGGLLTADDGTIKKVNLGEFAQMLNVDPKTLNNWKRSIPDFWGEVDKKRHMLFSGPRISAIWNGLFLRAARGDAEQAKIILSHFAGWQPPAQKHEIEVTTGLADLVARKKLELERKVIDATPADSTPNNA